MLQSFNDSGYNNSKINIEEAMFDDYCSSKFVLLVQLSRVPHLNAGRVLPAALTDCKLVIPLPADEYGALGFILTDPGKTDLRFLYPNHAVF